MTDFDRANMLAIFDESLDKIIKHLEAGRTDRALARAKDTQKAFRKCLGVILTDEQVVRKI